MIIRHTRAIAVAAVAGLLAVSGPAAAVAPTALSTTTSPVAAAAGWLAQQFVDANHAQSPAGDHMETSFGGQIFVDYGGTADAIFGFAAAKAGRTRINAAIGYLKGHADAYADLTKTQGFGPADGGVAKLALAATVSGSDATQFGDDPTNPGHPLDLLQHLKDDECAAGSTTCTPGSAANIGSSVSESLVVLAEARSVSTFAGKYAPSPAAIKYFLSLQCPNGGFTKLTNACNEDALATVDQTGYAVAALLALGGHQTEIDNAAAWLIRTRNAAGFWRFLGAPDVDSTALAVSALDATGRDNSTSRAWLVSQQATTGPTVGKGATRGGLKFAGAANAKATSDGLLGLVPGASLATLTADGAAAGTSVLALDAPRFASASLKQGAKQTATGTGFGAGEKVSAVLHSAPTALRTVPANASGTAVVTFTVPATLAVGSHSVVLTGATSGLTSTASFVVTAAPVAPVTPGTTTTPPTPVPSGSAVQGLADSGLDAQQALIEALVGLSCIVAGAGVLYLGRRRRT